MSDEQLVFSDAPIPDAQSDFDGWEPPPEFAPPPIPGDYSVYLTDINRPNEFTMADGTVCLGAQLNFRIIGGEQDDRAITFQFVGNNRMERGRGTGKFSSSMLDLLRSAGVQQAPRTNQEFYKALLSLKDRGKAAPFKLQADWEGSCRNCRERTLMEATGTDSPEAAQKNATKEQNKEANKYALKAKNSRAFPRNGNGELKDTFICPDCGDEVRARITVKRYYS